MNYQVVTSSLGTTVQGLKRLEAAADESRVRTREYARTLVGELNELRTCEEERFIRQVVRHTDYLKDELLQFGLVRPLHDFWENWFKWKMEEIRRCGELIRLEQLISAFRDLAASEVIWPAAVKMLSEWKEATSLAETIVFSGVAQHALENASLWELNLRGWPDPIRNEALKSIFCPVHIIREKAHWLEQEWRPKTRGTEGLFKEDIIEGLRKALEG